jgi:hypothetical protein
MGSAKLKTEALAEIYELARGWGRIVAQQAFGDEGPDLDVDFATFEEIAVQAARGATAGTCEALLAQQAKQLGEEQPCPECGQMCPVRWEERRMVVRGGEFQMAEPVCYCLTCRRDFFPSASTIED